MKISIGEIWLAFISILEFDKRGRISYKAQTRPCLIVDDGRGFIVNNDTRNYHILKITSQYDAYRRKSITNWKEIGLKKKSYTRIELPMKLEKNQLIKKIAIIPIEELIDIYSDIFNIINTKCLEQLANLCSNN